MKKGQVLCIIEAMKLMNEIEVKLLSFFCYYLIFIWETRAHRFLPY